MTSHDLLYDKIIPLSEERYKPKIPPFRSGMTDGTMFLVCMPDERLNDFDIKFEYICLQNLCFRKKMERTKQGQDAEAEATTHGEG